VPGTEYPTWRVHPIPVLQGHRPGTPGDRALESYGFRNYRVGPGGDSSVELGGQACYLGGQVDFRPDKSVYNGNNQKGGRAMRKLRIARLSVALLLSAFLGLGITSCASSSTSNGGDDAETATATNGYPSGMVVASPTTSGTAAASVNTPAGMSVSKATVTASSTFAEKITAFDTILAAASDSACQITLPLFTADVTNPNCYGPDLDYINHPDGAPAAGQLPSGDLGIWTATEVSGEACAAAKINSLMDTTGLKVDYVMLLAASMNCIMTLNGTALPSIDGDTVTLTTDLNTAIQVFNPDVTITTATIENLADVTDTDATVRDVFQYYIVSEDTTSGTTATTTSYMKHMPTATDNSTYKGKLWSEIDSAMSAGDKNAYSITYEKSSANTLIYKMLSADYMPYATSMTLFTTTGDIDITGGWTGGMAQAILNVNDTTGYGDSSYGWQAGPGDSNARIFNTHTEAGIGCGFFGYGTNFDTTTGTATDNVIDGFICNWAGPDNDRSVSTTANMAQKQGMTVNATTGIFEVDATKDNITYAPDNSCNGDGTFATKLTTETTYTVAPLANDLVTLATDTDFATYTAPTAPDLPSGF